MDLLGVFIIRTLRGWEKVSTLQPQPLQFILDHQRGLELDISVLTCLGGDNKTYLTDFPIRFSNSQNLVRPTSTKSMNFPVFPYVIPLVRRPSDPGLRGGFWRIWSISEPRRSLETCHDIGKRKIIRSIHFWHLETRLRTSCWSKVEKKTIEISEIFGNFRKTVNFVQRRIRNNPAPPL